MNVMGFLFILKKIDSGERWKMSLNEIWFFAIKNLYVGLLKALAIEK